MSVRRRHASMPPWRGWGKPMHRASRSCIWRAASDYMGLVSVVHLEGSIGLHGIGFGGGGSVLRGLLGAISGVAFDGGAGRARVAAEQAAVQESYVDYHAAVLGALRDVEDALADLAAARERRASLRAAAEISANAANLALLAYADGKVEVDAVLAAHAALRTSDDELVLAEVALSTAHVRLYKALGGGWQPDESPP
jgi:outer membrane protein, multidrug efflux system